MKIPKTRLALPVAALAVMIAGPSAVAAAEEVIPPGNSAATQYTEAFPTPGGDKKTDEAAHHRSPVKVLGNRNTRKLQQEGADGQAAAETAAATAPAPAVTETTVPTDDSQDEGLAGGGSSPGKGNGGSVPGKQKAQQNQGSTGAQVVAVELSDGSSGIGSAIEQATGLSTSGQSGMLLPLVIFATIILSLAYLWRQRREVD